jgi:tight adherence protein B
MTSQRATLERYLLAAISSTAAALITFLLTQSFVIAISVASVIAMLIYLSRARIQDSTNEKLTRAIPEIIDNVISAVQSGLSLTESLVSLKARGPAATRTFFAEFEGKVRGGESFKSGVEHLQMRFDNRSSDQLFEALIFAHSLGGRELLVLLRQISAFTRQDIALREEIISKQSWVRNSAHVSAAAPWILLVLLSMQPNTAQLYATPTGILILGTGVFLTVIAYLWMSQLSQMPEPVRVFGVQR